MPRLGKINYVKVELHIHYIRQLKSHVSLHTFIALILHISVNIIVCLSDRSGVEWPGILGKLGEDEHNYFSSTYSGRCMLSVSLWNIEPCTLHNQLQICRYICM